MYKMQINVLKFELMSGAISKSFFAYGMAKNVTTSLGIINRTQL